MQTDVFGSAVQFARSEGIIPAPESAHAIHGAVELRQAADEEGRERTILFNLSGHGHFDLGAYDAYLAGKLEDFELPEAEIARALGRSSRCRSPRASPSKRRAHQAAFRWARAKRRRSFRASD